MRALLSFHLIMDHCVKKLVFRDYCVSITLKNIYKNIAFSLPNPPSLSSLPPSLTCRHLPPPSSRAATLTFFSIPSSLPTPTGTKFESEVDELIDSNDETIDSGTEGDLVFESKGAIEGAEEVVGEGGDGGGGGVSVNGDDAGFSTGIAEKSNLIRHQL
ncbi:hypothetical protein HanIR_Chr17g0870421 [Helianthus annuus]|nr:hypothetical protein HanIR_Chr17g0870421 [Helianthus annuus]